MDGIAEFTYGILPESIQSATSVDNIAYVLSRMTTQLIIIVVALIGCALLLVLAGKIYKKAAGLIRISSVTAFFLVACMMVNWILLGPMNNLVSAAFADTKELSQETMEASRSLVAEIASEGVVMTKNTDDTLPLTGVTNLNVFGWASTNPVYGGTGSGAVDVSKAVSLLDGLEAGGFSVNQELVEFYTDYEDTRLVADVMIGEADWTLPEPNVSEYSEELLEQAREFSDVAVVVLSRVGGEANDLPTDMTAVLDGTYDAGDGDVFADLDSTALYDDSRNVGNDWDEGDTYLNLTNREEELVELVCDNFDTVIVVYNSANAMDMAWTNQYEQIKGVLICPPAGETGFVALGQILSGQVNPSGRTVDTWITDLQQAPWFQNIGAMSYDNTADFEAVIAAQEDSTGYSGRTSFINYVEGIYVGYKFYETAAVEGLIDYDSVVVYPFGYGLSYTSFEQALDAMTVNDGEILLTVTVTNTGSVAGKDVVQVYYNPPYTNGGIEKASANLITFQKTEELQPGDSQTLELNFEVEDMASYDATGYGCYVLEAGDYVISIQADSHTQLASSVYTQEETVVYDQDHPRSDDLTAAVNQFDFASSDSYTTLSRADGFANYEEAVAAPSSYSMPEDVMATLSGNGIYDETQYNVADDVMPTQGASNGLELADLRGADYDDDRWEQLLDQLTVEDMSNLIANCGYQTVAIQSIGKVATIDTDGPAGVNSFMTDMYGTGFPSEMFIAQTWNLDLAYASGQALGQEMEEFGIAGWYGPAVNIHRSPFAGRNFEYYSEDSVLSGYMAAQQQAGAAEHGVYAYLKHFALNDQEANRTAFLCTWADEQTIREIYLKPFEIAIKENPGVATAVMSSFNFIGTTPAGACAPLLNTVLREEWGFQGFVASDYFVGIGYQDADRFIRAGNDGMLATVASTAYVDDTESATSILTMRQASKNILYTVVNSLAYGEDADTGPAAWMVTLGLVDAVVVILLAAVEVLAIRSYRKKQRKPEADEQ